MPEESPSAGPLLGLTPPPKRSLADDVVERLRDAILHGGFKPGEPLREEQLAAMLDVSRGPVREALVQLEREGLVLVRRHRGATVARLSRGDLEEVYSLRLALERLATQRAVRYATEQDFKAMEAVLEAFDVVLSRSPSEKEVAELDVRFHDLICHRQSDARAFDGEAAGGGATGELAKDLPPLLRTDARSVIRDGDGDGAVARGDGQSHGRGFR